MTEGKNEIVTETSNAVGEWTSEMQQDFHLAALNARLGDMGDAVLQACNQAIEALRLREAALADRVIAGDDRIDCMDLDIDQQCTGYLISDTGTRQQRRQIVALVHVAATLERIADHATEIALLAFELSMRSRMDPPETLWEMARLSANMVTSAFAAFRSGNVRLAHKVCAEDERVDLYYTQVTASLMHLAKQDDSRMMPAIFYMFAASHFERMADLATNIGERVIHWRTGELRKLNV